MGIHAWPGNGHLYFMNYRKYFLFVKYLCFSTEKKINKNKSEKKKYKQERVLYITVLVK